MLWWCPPGALQCLSNTQPLTFYFLSSFFAFEINSSNKMGTAGEFAHAYSDTLRKMWAASPMSG